MTPRLPVLTAVLWLSAAVPLAGAAADPHGHRHQGAHVHGLAGLDIAWQGGDVFVGLRSPAESIVGFEHAPASPREHQALEAALETLRDGERLLRFSTEAGCRLVEARPSAPMLEGESHGEHGGGHAEGTAGVHADISVEYRFSCARPQRLETLEVGLFKAFPRLERVRVQLVSEKGQAAAELTASDPALAL